MNYAYLAALAQLRKVQDMLMCEHIPHDERVSDGGWAWIENVPAGPAEGSIARLWTIQSALGAENVTTGESSPVTPGMVGIYRREQSS